VANLFQGSGSCAEHGLEDGSDRAASKLLLEFFADDWREFGHFVCESEHGRRRKWVDQLAKPPKNQMLYDLHDLIKGQTFLNTHLLETLQRTEDRNAVNQDRRGVSRDDFLN
jgi:hypothetical protein